MLIMAHMHTRLACGIYGVNCTEFAEFTSLAHFRGPAPQLSPTIKPQTNLDLVSAWKLGRTYYNRNSFLRD